MVDVEVVEDVELVVEDEVDEDVVVVLDVELVVEVDVELLVELLVVVVVDEEVVVGAVAGFPTQKGSAATIRAVRITATARRSAFISSPDT